MRILIFCTLLGMSFAALTYSREGGQSSLPAYQAAVPLSGDYKPQRSRRPSSHKHQSDYIPPAYRHPQRNFKPSHEPRNNNQEQYYESQKTAYNPVHKQQQPSGERYSTYEPRPYRPVVHQEQYGYKTPVSYQSQRYHEPQDSYQEQEEDLGPDTSNFRYQVPIYDSKTYGNAAVEVNRFPGGATYQLNQNAHGSDVKVNFETSPSGRQAYKPHY